MSRLHSRGYRSVSERFPEPGDYPDTACEYLLPDADYVFISSSSFVNKTTPRLLDLAIGGGAHTVLVGPSTPMHPLLLDLGVDTVTGYVPDPEVGRAEALRLVPALRGEALLWFLFERGQHVPIPMVFY